MKILKHIKTLLFIATIATSQNIEAMNLFGEPRLSQAVLLGNYNLVSDLLKQGAEVDKKGSFGKTALSLAARAGKTKIMRLLIKNGANLELANDGGFTPLHCAAGTKNIAAVELLLDYHAKVDAETLNGFTPLEIALSMDHYDIATLLLKNGANFSNCAKGALVNLHLPRIANLFPAIAGRENNSDEDYLYVAVASDNYGAVKFLLNQGLEPNSRRNGHVSPLYVAADLNHFTTAKVLLEYGAKVDQELLGKTPLDCALVAKSYDTAALLLRSGAMLTEYAKELLLKGD